MVNNLTTMLDTNLFKTIISKHEYLYQYDTEYKIYIDIFLFENLKDFIAKYEISDDIVEIVDDSSNENVVTDDTDYEDNTIKSIESKNQPLNKDTDLDTAQDLVKVDLTQLRNEITNEIITEITNEVTNKVSNEIRTQYENETKKLNKEIETLKLDYNNEINQLKLKHQNELELQKIEFENKILATTITKTSIGLGNIGEENLREMFTKMGKNIVDTHKTNHVCDIWIVDDINKILYVIESKNKKNIITEDIEKFKSDLLNIRQNIIPKKYPDYKSTGLFISLNSDTINSQIGSFSFTLDVTYISSKYVFEEFFEVYFKSIEAVFNIPKTEEYEKVLNLIIGEYQQMTCLIDICDRINQNAEFIIEDIEDISSQINKRVKDFKKYLIDLKSQNSEQLRVEEEIKKYIKENPNFKLVTVKEMGKKYGIFKGKITKQGVIDWANK